MSQSRRQGNTLLISLGVFILFVLSNLITDPASGTPAPLNDATRSVTVSTTATSTTTAAAPVSTDRDGDFRFEATPIKPRRSRIGSLTMSAKDDGNFNHCLIDFNDASIIAQLPLQAVTTEVEWPYWNQYCPSPDIAVAGHPVGVQPDLINYPIRVFAYDINTKERIKFDLNQIRIVSGQAEVCFVKTDLPLIAAEPTDQPPGHCGDLGTGNWDVSASVVGAYEVRIYARSNKMSFNDLGIRTS